LSTQSTPRALASVYVGVRPRAGNGSAISNPAPRERSCSLLKRVEYRFPTETQIRYVERLPGRGDQVDSTPGTKFVVSRAEPDELGEWVVTCVASRDFRQESQRLARSMQGLARELRQRAIEVAEATVGRSAGVVPGTVRLRESSAGDERGMANPSPVGSDVSAGTYRCTNCSYELDTSSIKHLPPCPNCDGPYSWEALSGGGQRQ
jgi:hypothetical protein